MSWRTTLNEIRTQKLYLARLDPQRGMPVLPPLGACPKEIAAVERKLGRRLPPSYAEFLAVHDGFPELLHGTSLLGAHHLLRGTYEGIARMVIDLGETPISPNARRTWPPPIVPFGVDPAGETIFAWDTSAASPGGE